MGDGAGGRSPSGSVPGCLSVPTAWEQEHFAQGLQLRNPRYQTPRNEISQPNYQNGLNVPSPSLAQPQTFDIKTGICVLYWFCFCPCSQPSQEPDYPLKGLLEVQKPSWQWHRQETDPGIEHLWNSSGLEQRETRIWVRSGIKTFFTFLEL